MYGRKLLWLEVCFSNKNTRTVATFYMDTVIELRGVPKFFREDIGVENIFVASMQKF